MINRSITTAFAANLLVASRNQENVTVAGSIYEHHELKQVFDLIIDYYAHIDAKQDKTKEGI